MVDATPLTAQGHFYLSTSFFLLSGKSLICCREIPQQIGLQDEDHEHTEDEGVKQYWGEAGTSSPGSEAKDDASNE